MENSRIGLAEGVEHIARCYEVMKQLRPHLSAQAFQDQVLRQQAREGYKLAFVEHEGHVRALAGFRFLECLAWGEILYVDDLVTRAEDHGKGYGSLLFDWVVEQARVKGCAQFHLDSGVQRVGAHRFYLHKGLDITCHHFGMKLEVS